MSLGLRSLHCLCCCLFNKMARMRSCSDTYIRAVAWKPSHTVWRFCVRVGFSKMDPFDVSERAIRKNWASVTRWSLSPALYTPTTKQKTLYIRTLDPSGSWRVIEPSSLPKYAALQMLVKIPTSTTPVMSLICFSK